MFQSFFDTYKNPTQLAESGERLEKQLERLGLQIRRAAILRRLSQEYLDGKPIEQCFGVGQYGRDALKIFVDGRTDVKPHDRFLKLYLTWRKRYGRFSASSKGI